MLFLYLLLNHYKPLELKLSVYIIRVQKGDRVKIETRCTGHIKSHHTRTKICVQHRHYSNNSTKYF